MVYDICAIAHITKDVNTTPAGIRTMPGGAGYYFSKSLHHLGSHALLVTKFSPRDDLLKGELNDLNTLIYQSEQSHFFENIYEDYTDNRQQKAHSLADPFNAEDIREIQARYFHLSPLAPNDIPIEIFKELSTRSKISLDVQGYTRKIIHGIVSNSIWDQLPEALRMVHILKVSESESAIITGETNPIKAVIALSDYGIPEVILTRGQKGSLIYFENEHHEVPAYQPQALVDPTGCGDTYMAGYLHQRSQGKGIIEAGKFGAAMATLKIEQFGAFSGEFRGIQALVDNYGTNRPGDH